MKSKNLYVLTEDDWKEIDGTVFQKRLANIDITPEASTLIDLVISGSHLPSLIDVINKSVNMLAFHIRQSSIGNVTPDNYSSVVLSAKEESLVIEAAIVAINKLKVTDRKKANKSLKKSEITCFVGDYLFCNFARLGFAIGSIHQNASMFYTMPLFDYS